MLQDIKKISGQVYEYLNKNQTKLGREFESFPGGTCRDSSWILAMVLKERLGIKCKIVFCDRIYESDLKSKKDGLALSHCWLKINLGADGCLDIDITANQFEDIESFIIKVDSKWHKEHWEIKNTYDFDIIESKYIKIYLELIDIAKI